MLFGTWLYPLARFRAHKSDSNSPSMSIARIMYESVQNLHDSILIYQLVKTVAARKFSQSMKLCSLSELLILLHGIKNNAWVTVNNDFWVTRENYWQIASRVIQKSLFTVTNVLFYFLHAIWCPIPPKQLSIADFAVVAKDSLFRFSIVTSPQLICDVTTLALWRHIRRLFLHAQIGAKAIFTSE